MTQPTEPSPRGQLCGAAVCLALAALLVCVLGPCSRARGAEVANQLALAKCRLVWQHANPSTYDAGLADWFVSRHYAAGVGPDWIYSLVYCWSGSDLNPRMVSGDTLGGYHARGLVDTLWSTHRGNRASVAVTLEARGLEWNEQVLHDPYVATRLHLIEWIAYRDPTSEWRTARKVFLPGAPDGARAYREQTRRWEPRLAKAKTWITRAYREGRLP
jgi:hypothetical protein